MTTTYATDLKLKELAYRKLEAKNGELERKFKEAFESGQASAIPRIRELEKRLDKATTMIVNHEAKLSFTIEALEEIKDYGYKPNDKESVEIWNFANKALAAIKGDGA